MLIELDTDVLKDNCIEPSWFVFMFLCYSGKKDLAWELCNPSEEVLKGLQYDGFLKIGEQHKLNPDSNVYIARWEVTIRQKFIDLIEDDQDRIVSRIMSIYPQTEMREGEKVQLQQNRQKIKAKILKEVGNNKTKADLIIKGIQNHLNNRSNSIKAQYLPDLLVYLNQERWKLWLEEGSKKTDWKTKSI